MVIYKFTNKINSKCYIGQTTKDLSTRRKKHIVTSKRSNTYFHNALKKYDSGDFKWEVLCECESKDELNEMEFHYIKQYNSHWTKHGYNIDIGGYNGPCLMGKDNGMYGKHHSKESKIKMSENHSNMKGKNNPMYGRKRSKKLKESVSKSNKGRKSWCSGLTKETDERVKLYTEKRNQTMIEKGLYKSGRNHPLFRKLNEDKIIELYNNGYSNYKIGKLMKENKGTIKNRILLLLNEGKLNEIRSKREI
jgi:group I intron endonuclease